MFHHIVDSKNDVTLTTTAKKARKCSVEYSSRHTVRTGVTPVSRLARRVRTCCESASVLFFTPLRALVQRRNSAAVNMLYGLYYVLLDVMEFGKCKGGSV